MRDHRSFLLNKKKDIDFEKASGKRWYTKIGALAIKLDGLEN